MKGDGRQYHRQRGRGESAEWVRLDLTSKDPAVRSRAEETLAAIIAATLCPELLNVEEAGWA